MVLTESNVSPIEKTECITECIDTILELLELKPVPGKNPSDCEDPTCVIVKGYHKPGDGGGGTFFWDGSCNVDLINFPEGEDFGTGT